MDSRAWVFHGVVPFGVVIVCAKTLEEACKIANIDPEKTKKWLESPDIRKYPYEYEELECGGSAEFSE